MRVSDSAISLFKTEWGFAGGDHIRVYPRYGGGGPNPYMIGIAKQEPRYVGVSAVNQDITFFMEQDDVWFLGGKDLLIDTKDGEIAFQFQ